MATSGTNNTVKWTLSNGVLTISPTSGNSGIARKDWGGTADLARWITLTTDEISSVQTIVFTGDIQFYSKEFGKDIYSKETKLNTFLYDFKNASTIDVSGLNTTGVEEFVMFFPRSLMNLIGLSSMDVASGKDFSRMFYGVKLESLDLSTFPLNSADDIGYMLNNLSYCHTVKLPSDFSRKFAFFSSFSGQNDYSFGLASSRIPATKDGVTVTSDEDFFKLDSAQGGTWTRDISGSATLSFKVKSTSREANIATVNYQYATSSATVSIYLKKASESSFPSTSSKTVTISGTGSGSVEIELTTDDAYDIKMVASDGNTSIYAYPSVGSNILLFEVDEEGNVNFSGGITTGGDVHVDEKNGYFADLFVNCNTNSSGGKKIGENKVLWSGALFMDASHTARLSEKVSEQLTGIVLVWSYYTNGAAQKYGWHTTFIPKAMVQLHNGVGWDIELRRTKNATFGTKYVYVNDDRIVGHADNVATGTANNVPYKNNQWVLRYVFGC